MRYSLAISIAVHAAILAAAVVALPAPDKYKVEDQESIPVDIVSIEDLSQRKATVKADEKKEEAKPAPPKPEVEEKKPEQKLAEEVKKAALEPEAAPEPEPLPIEKQPDPTPLEELIKKTEKPKPQEEKTAEALPSKPKPEKTKKKPQRELDVDKVAALLNKIDDEQASPPDIEENTGTPDQGEFDMASGEDAKLSANEIDWLRQRLRECWNPPVGVMEAQGLEVHVQIELDQSGAVLGQPAVVNQSMHPLFDVAASSAVRAVMRCQPFDRLPIAKYESWRSIIFNFDPQEMFSG
jgi:outer membrane biosynthesis protein TonB